MAMTVNTNVTSLTAQRNLMSTQKTQNTAIQRLSSGLRINSAKDDAAGLAISDRMNSQIKGLNQSVRNANDGISLAQTAEGALQETTNLLQRMRELSVQSANDTNSDSDRQSLQDEVGQIQAEINRIADTTSFNGKKLLDGSFGTAKFHVGAEANQTIDVTTGDARGTSLGANQTFMKSESGIGTDAATAKTAAAFTNTTFTVNGSRGSSGTITNGAEDSAKDIAADVNGKTVDTGVTATAKTKVELSSIDDGTYSFSLGTTSGSADITANVSNGDLSSMVDAINDHSAETGVTASLSENGGSVIIEDNDGDTIALERKDATVGGTAKEWTAESFNADGTKSAAVTVQSAGGNDAASFRGNVTMESDKGFSVVGVDAADMTTGASKLSSVAQVNITTQSGSNDAISVIDKAIAKVDSIRSNLGATQNRFDATISNLTNVSENISASKSRILDADFAKETAAMTKAQIMSQAGTSMLSQANQLPNSALSLLG